MQRNIDFSENTAIQPRAQRTVTDLFEATAQLLENDAPERLTTNHVAARAGYSIGTLYRYFPSKLALLRAMALRETLTQVANVHVAVELLPSPASPEQVARIFVRAALHPFAGRHRVHAGVKRLLASGDERAIKDALLEAPSGPLPELSEETKFLMIHAVTGVIEAALFSNPELIGSADFEDQLVGLVLHFAMADQASSMPAD
jgi:AcrR family transcriptional regulator